MGLIISKEFVIGTGNGQYLGTTGKLVDSVLGLSNISSIMVNNTPHNSGYNHIKANSTLDLNNLYPAPISNGTIITVNFETAVYIR